MSGIPSDIAASSLQAGVHARDVARQRDADRVQQAQITEKRQAKVEEAGATVETEDGDTAVFSDAEGTGSQGRAFDDEHADQPEAPPAESPPPPEGGLDLKA
jgi:hypothetical protein